ncbi:MAG: HD domain-containing protein [Ruminococcus sp.]|nr:HD domain-containing protein [Ruminococcus sp.]
MEMINERLQKQMKFMVEIDKMKNIYRQTYVLGENRKENDAEHSWHIAVMAFMLAEYSAEPVDVLKTMKMLLIHDIVEIDAGDTYCYDSDGYKTKADREEKAAQRIFGLLPDDQQKEFYSLWREFEDGSTSEAKFAAVLDRLQPLTLNYAKDGISWREHEVHRKQVEKRNLTTAETAPELGELLKAMLDDADSKGFFIK